MKKILLSLIFVILGITAFGQVSNKNLEIKKANPQIYLNGTNPLIKTKADTFAVKSDIRTEISNKMGNIDSLRSENDEYFIYEGTTQLAPNIPAESKLDLESIAVDLDTALMESDAYTRVYEPWKLIYPETDVVAKAFGTTMHPSTSSCIVTATDGRMYLSLYYVSETTLVTGARAMAGAASTPNFTNGDNYNGFVIYSISEGVATLVDSTVNDSIIWKKAAGSSVSGAFTSTVTLEAGWYYVGTLANWSADPGTGNHCVIAGWNLSYGGVNTLYGLPSTLKYRVLLSSLSAPPATFTIAAASNGIFTADIILYYTAP